MFALEFARLVAARGDALGGEPLAMPSSLRELVRERVAGFPAEIRPLLEFVATLERPTLAIIGRAFEADENLLAVAQRAEAVTVGDDGIVRFAHPLIASSVYNEATPQRRRELHAEAAGLVTDPEARARHLALAAVGPDAAVAALLDEAAQRASARGSPDAAAELAERARVLTAPSMRRERTRRALAAARYLMDAWQVKRAAETLDTLLADGAMGPDRAEALQLRATVEQDGSVAIPLLESALEHAGDDRVLRARILGHLAIGIAFWRGDPRSAELRAHEAVALAEELGDPVVLSENLTTLGQIASLNGRPYADTMASAVALDADPTECRQALRAPCSARSTPGAAISELHGICSSRSSSRRRGMVRRGAPSCC